MKPLPIDTTILPRDARSSGSEAPTPMPFSDVKDLRIRAREHIEQGAVTGSYRADRDIVIRLLNEALASELVCVLRYKRHYFVAQGLHGKAIASEFLAHAEEEQAHADRICERITQLNGIPNLDPADMASRAHSEYGSGLSLTDMIRDDLVAERIAIESYGEAIRYLGDDDPTTRRLFEEILAKEEEHAEDMSDLLVTHGGLE